MFELRWLIRDDVEVLQYRTTITVPDYSSKDYVPVQKYTEWQDIPKVIEE